VYKISSTCKGHRRKKLVWGLSLLFKIPITSYEDALKGKENKANFVAASKSDQQNNEAEIK